MPLLASLSLCLTLGAAGPWLPLDRPAPRRPPPAMRVGAALAGVGGVVMVVGAGVLVPLSLSRATRAQAPNPDDYTAVAPFEHDLYLYKLELYRATQLGVAGAIVSVAGAALFVTGAITWGVGRHRARRSGFALVPGRGSVTGSLSLRF